MIIGKQKPFEEIRDMVKDYKKVLVLGCGTCVAICLAGGNKEASILSLSLSMAEKVDGNEKVFSEYTIQRQCEHEFLAELDERVKEVDAVLSLACGIGVQAVAERFPNIPVLPGLNTTFLGFPRQHGVWVEFCSACGNCILDQTGGICPLTRCTKGLLNGPCGGTNNGKCEVDQEKDCAWTLIYKQLEKQGKLDLMRAYYSPRNFQVVVRPGKVTAEQGGEDGKVV